jgi:DNA modification methylase
MDSERLRESADHQAESGIPRDLAEQVRAALDQGHFLPDELRSALFESKREYELTYFDKRREADILAETMAVPLQPVKTFGDSAGGWSNKLILGDNLQVLKSLLQMKERGELLDSEGNPGITLIYIDPPFATRQEFRGKQAEQAYQDKVAGSRFLEFLRKRLIFMRELLTTTGVIYVHLDTRKVHYTKVLMDEIFGENNFRNEIIWYYRGGAVSPKNWGRRHDSILVYSRSGDWVFNVDPVRTPYSEESMERLKYKAKVFRGERVYSGYEPHPLGKHPDDVWELQPLMPSEKLRTGYPTQKPPDLVERVILASSNPNDVVLDAFLGSGTTAAVAERHGRRWIGIDCGKLAIYISQKMLLNLGADRRSLLSVQPFSLYNAGLYDFKLLRSLSWEDFRRFALELFQCRDDRHDLGRFAVDGYLGLDHVLVFNFQKHRKAVLDETFVRDLHEAVGDRVGRRFFIIAPAAAVQFLEDYIELEGPRIPIRYFVLRIPYSVIDEIHRQGFSRLQQPSSLETVNDTVDSIGFDFIQPPTVNCTYTKSKTELKVKIREFETEAMRRDGDSPEGFDALAMVMADLDYDGNVFDLDQVIYADELERAANSFSFPLSSVGKRMMLIYVDVHGNEHREVKRVSDFRIARRKA